MGSNTGAVDADSTAVGRGWLDRPTATLALGDVGVVVAVLVAGELSHGIGPLSQPLRVAQTVVPFVAGWLLLSTLLGIYGDRCWDLSWSLRTAVGAWIGAANVGLIVRNAPWVAGGLTWPFPLVVTGFVSLGLLVWRGVAVLVLGSRTN